MPTPIIMPKFEMSQETGTVARWLKAEGDAIQKGDAILEVETDKITMEVESPASGMLTGICAQPGTVVPIGQVIAYVLRAGEVIGAGREAEDGTQNRENKERKTADAVPAPAASRVQPAVKATPIAEKIAAEHGLNLTAIAGSGKDGQITRIDVEAALAAQQSAPASTPAAPNAVPAARRLARKLDVDLAQVKGSGPEGRIQSKDVSGKADVVVSSTQVAPAIPTTQPTPATPNRTTARIKPLSPLRRTIALRMIASVNEAPQFNLSADINMARALAMVEDHKSAGQASTPRVTVTALLVKACAWALARHPAMNAAFTSEGIAEYSDINIGVAVAIDDGLIVPVIRNADRLSLTGIAAALSELTERSRSNKLTLAHIQGGTFSISNLGMFAVDRFAAIVNPPQAAILAVGRTTKRFVPDANDQPVAAPMCTFTISADHRTVDGAVVGRFMGDLQNAVERPGLML